MSKPDKIYKPIGFYSQLQSSPRANQIQPHKSIQNKLHKYSVSRLHWILPIIMICVGIVLSLYYASSGNAETVYRSGLSQQQKIYINNHLRNLQQYLLRYNVESLLQVKCDFTCLLNQRQEQIQDIRIDYTDKIHQYQPYSDYIQYYDWINFNNINIIEMETQKLISLIKLIKHSSRIGVSFTYSMKNFISYKISDIQRVRVLFKKYGLTYNTIESLTLRRAQGRAIQIYNRFSKRLDIDQIRDKANLVAIKTQFSLEQDIPFIRQWIAFNIAVGIDLIFMYQTKNDTLYSCANAPQAQLRKQWQKIYKQYFNNIIYIPWHSNQLIQSSNFFQSRPSSDQDFLYYYRNAIKYGVFLNTKQIIFSGIGLKMSVSLLQASLSGYNMFQFEVKKFVHRLCSPSQFILNNYQYYQEPVSLIQKRVIFEMQTYKNSIFSYLDMLLSTNKFQFNNKHWKIQSYSLAKREILELQRRQKFPKLYLSYDFSAQNRASISSIACERKCFIQVNKKCLEQQKIQCPTHFQKLIIPDFKLQI